MEHTYGVIMAGGKGERFWPLSTNKVPKPFIRLLATKTMIQMTVERLLKIVPENRIMVVLGAEHLVIAQEQLSCWPGVQFLVEPAGRDTAPCIGLAAVTLQREDPKALMIVVPADHYIPDELLFAETMGKGVRLARKDTRLVTTGIKPTRPETGYGYIQAGQRLQGASGYACFEVQRFVEKPDVRRAADYLAEGGYYWNSGIFVWQAQAVLQGIGQHMPSLYEGLMRIDEAIITNHDEKIDEIFRGFESISIDYGLMEKADNVLMVKANFGWDDVGTWGSLFRVLELDRSGNYTRGEPICIDTQDCVIYGDDITVGTIGVSNLIIVASKEGVLVCDVNRDQDTRKIAKLLEKS